MSSLVYLGRAAIGFCEGGFIPGVILFATYFYKSKELSIRLAAFWSSLNVARVISALLAAGILEMRGIGGKPGWFWLFLLEGLFTVVIAILSYMYLPASPTSTKNSLWRKSWYTEREETIMVNRILRDDPAKGLTALKEPATFKDIRAAWSDQSMWGLYFIGLVAYSKCHACPLQANRASLISGDLLTLCLCSSRFSSPGLPYVDTQTARLLDVQQQHVNRSIGCTPNHHNVGFGILERLFQRARLPLHPRRILDHAATDRTTHTP